MGIGLPQDRAAAAACYKQAAEKGHRGAQARWGYALMDGQRRPEPNLVEGESWLRRAALAGDPEAAALVGDIYAKGGKPAAELRRGRRCGSAAPPTPTTRGPRAPWVCFTSPAPACHATRRKPPSCSASPPKAATQRPCRSRQPAAARSRQRSRTQIRTRSWFEQAAESGDLIAAFNFGVCLAEGVGIERDDRKAAEWLRRAADGVVNAQYWYGRMLVEGRGVEANPEEGRNCGSQRRPRSA